MERKHRERLCELLESSLVDETKNRNSLSSVDSVTYVERSLAAIDHLKHLDYMELKTDYYDTVLREMEDGGRSGGMDPERDMMSGRRGRDSRGRYTSRSGDDGSYRGSYNDGRRMSGHTERMDDDYMESKRSYRSGAKNSENKERMTGALERTVDDMVNAIISYYDDADIPEEKDIIRRAAKKLGNNLD